MIDKFVKLNGFFFFFLKEYTYKNLVSFLDHYIFLLCCDKSYNHETYKKKLINLDDRLKKKTIEYVCKS